MFQWTDVYQKLTTSKVELNMVLEALHGKLSMYTWFAV